MVSEYKQNITATAGSIFFLLSISACGDDEDLMVQDHDQNEFMIIVHKMHAEMDAMHMIGDAEHDDHPPSGRV